MIIESLLSDDDSSTLIQTGYETFHFQNADKTYLSVSNELDISNNQIFSSTESCYQSDSKIEINLTGSDGKKASHQIEKGVKNYNKLFLHGLGITDVLNHILMNYL